MNKILLSSHNTWSIYNFRTNLIKKLIARGVEVHIYSPIDKYEQKLIDLGCIVHKSNFTGRSKNILREFIALLCWIIFLKKNKFDMCLHFGIKPNIYGSIASQINKVPYVNNITGLGEIFQKKSLLQVIITKLYSLTQKRAKKVFFQNKDDLDIFIKSKIIDNTSSYDLLPGSGVNLLRFKQKNYDNDDNKKINFFFIGRLLKSKGINLFIDAAETIFYENEFKDTQFFIVGFFENEASNDSISRKDLDNAIEKGFVKYLGMTDEMEKILLDAHCVVLPSFYREGTPKILLESCATGIPIITTDSVGCKNVIEDNLNGFMIKPNNLDDLVLSIKKFLKLTKEERAEMGNYGRKKVEREFDEDIVINKYLELLHD